MAGKTSKAEKKLVECIVPDDMFALQSGKHQTFISVNGRGYLVKTGETVLVPPEVKEVVENRKAAKKAAENYVEKTALKTYNPANI